MFLANCFPLLCKIVVLVLHCRSLEMISFVLEQKSKCNVRQPQRIITRVSAQCGKQHQGHHHLSASASQGPTAPRSPSSPSILILVRLPRRSPDAEFTVGPKTYLFERIFFLISAILLMSSLSERGFNWSATDWSPACWAPYFMAS